MSKPETSAEGRRVALQEFREGLSAYVASVIEGDALVITVRGKPALQVTPYAAPEE